MSNQIQVGDTVYLPSNSSHRMTVTNVDKGDATVAWTYDGAIKYSTVPVAALKKVERR